MRATSPETISAPERFAVHANEVLLRSAYEAMAAGDRRGLAISLAPTTGPTRSSVSGRPSPRTPAATCDSTCETCSPTTSAVSSSSLLVASAAGDASTNAELRCSSSSVTAPSPEQRSSTRTRLRTTPSGPTDRRPAPSTTHDTRPIPPPADLGTLRIGARSGDGIGCRSAQRGPCHLPALLGRYRAAQIAGSARRSRDRRSRELPAHIVRNKFKRSPRTASGAPLNRSVVPEKARAGRMDCPIAV